MRQLISSMLFILESKESLRSFFVRYLYRLVSFVPYQRRLQMGSVARPYYGHCIYSAARLADRLGYKKISILEFGVAGGNGLANIEYHIDQIKKENKIKVDFEVYGFDRKIGLPKPESYKDLAYFWKTGFYKMNLSKLKERLQSAKLIFGDVNKTTRAFKGAPIACIFFDLDFYSSTKKAFNIFKKAHLPRVFCFFDDVVGNDLCLYNDYTGELLAINEYNTKNKFRKIAPIKYKVANKDNIYIFHDFKHKMYNQYINLEDGTACNLEEL